MKNYPLVFAFDQVLSLFYEPFPLCDLVSGSGEPDLRGGLDITAKYDNVAYFWWVWLFLGYDLCMNYRRIYLDSYSYYLTLVTHGRKPLLVEHIDLLREAFRLSKQKYDYAIEAIVILPDHLHMIIRPKIATEYSKIIRHIKRSFVYGLSEELKEQARLELSHAKYHRGHAGIWQERFYEHTIRNEKDWLEKMEYIKHNPVKHQYVENLSDWKYSSFS